MMPSVESGGFRHLTHRITRLVGNRRLPAIVDDIDFADDDGEDDTPHYRSAFPPSAWLIDAANAAEIAKLRAVVAERRRHAIVIVRAKPDWREAMTNLLRLLLDSREELPLIRRKGTSEALNSVLAFLGHCHVVLTCQPGDAVPEVYKRLALVEIDAGRITAEHVDALIADRWPRSDVRWPADRDVVSIPSHHLPTAVYQAPQPDEIVEILDVIRRHDTDDAQPAEEEVVNDGAKPGHSGGVKPCHDGAFLRRRSSPGIRSLRFRRCPNRRRRRWPGFAPPVCRRQKSGGGPTTV